jgi:Flp pilus assembly protein CpaB
MRSAGRQRTLRRWAWRLRWIVVALCCGIAASSVVAQLSPAPPATRAVVVPTRDLPPGIPIAAGDLTVALVPALLAPPGTLTDPAQAVGRVPAALLVAAVPITSALVVGGELAALAPEGTVVVPVQLDQATAGLLRAGDHVDLVSTASDTPTYLARRALVVPAGSRASPNGDGGILGGGTSGPTVTLLAVSPADAPGLSAAANGRTIAAVLVP